MSVATYAAVGLNVVVTILALFLARFTAYESGQQSESAEAVQMSPGSKSVLFVIGLSGATALGAEVVWTRLMTLNFGGTTYTFSLILASFLFGIGIGSAVGSILARFVQDARHALGWTQFLVVAGLAWAAYLLTQALPYWPVSPDFAIKPWYNFQFDFVRAVLTALPAAALWGASFPLALAAVATKGQDPGRLVGRVYAANTLGAILGALLTSLVLIGSLGTQATQRMMIGIAALGALILLVTDRNYSGFVRIQSRSFFRGAGILITTLVLGWTVAPVPALLVGYGRYAATYQQSAEYFDWV